MTQAPAPEGDVPVYLAVPEGTGPWPGLVVIHDALGMTTDLHRQAEWLAGAGFLAAAPDLFHRGGRTRCLLAVMRQALAGKGGPSATSPPSGAGWPAWPNARAGSE